MRLLSLLVPAFLAALVIAVSVEDAMELHRRDCPGNPVPHRACPYGSFQVSVSSIQVPASE